MRCREDQVQRVIVTRVVCRRDQVPRPGGSGTQPWRRGEVVGVGVEGEVVGEVVVGEVGVAAIGMAVMRMSRMTWRTRTLLAA